MKKDILFPEVHDVAVAIVEQENEAKEKEYFTYFINYGKDDISNILITSQGYGKVNEKERRTSVLRHHIPKLPANSAAKVEPIVKEVFGLNNEYWVSFYIGSTIYDKKFVFLPETIQEPFMRQIPLLNKKGVLIK